MSDDPAAEYVPTIPSTSEYIRSLCHKNQELEAEVERLRTLLGLDSRAGR